MKLTIVSIKDRAIDQFGNPLSFISPGQAIRYFSDEINRKDDTNMYYKHPEDYDLYELGTYATETGHFDTGVPRQIAIGKDVSINFVQLNK